MNINHDSNELKSMNFSTEYSSLDSNNIIALNYGTISNNSKNSEIDHNPVDLNYESASLYGNNRLISDLPDSFHILASDLQSLCLEIILFL